MAIRFSARPMLGVASLALLCLAGCDKIKLITGGGAMAYAQAAIERNNQLELVAIDANNSVFTVRVKETGELKTVRADELVGVLPGAEAAGVKAATAPAPVPTQIAPPPTQVTDTDANADA